MKYYIRTTIARQITPQPSGQKTLLLGLSDGNYLTLAYCDFRPGKPERWKRASGYFVEAKSDMSITSISEGQAAMILFEAKI